MRLTEKMSREALLKAIADTEKRLDDLKTAFLVLANSRDLETIAIRIMLNRSVLTRLRAELARREAT